MHPIPRHLWTPDHAQPTCTSCSLPFTLCRRRHHCRWCGGLFCSECTPHFISLHSISLHSISLDQDTGRSCERCFDTHNKEREDQITVCPFCSESLHPQTTEQHLSQCCQSHADTTVGNRFAVSEVKGGGVPGECDICMESFAEGQSLAVLNCLCKFHEHCISEWFNRGHCCPFHPGC